MQEMASTPLIQFPVFAPTKPHHHRRRPATEIRFSRWNNANAEKFNGPKRTQKEIEDQLRFHKRYDSALNIAHSYSPAPPTPTFKSTGTPSAPSRPSIPGKKSKYSKTQNPADIHPAFKPLLERKRFSTKRGPSPPILPEKEKETEKVNVKIDDNGLVYELPDAPFVYQYSYTETPKVKPVGIREPLVAPFEPSTMARPWTGRKPLPPSKKKLPEFDSFKLPPPNKKGVKTVQPPGPYLPGSGPKYVKSREEILGEPLTQEEIVELVESAKKWKRQLNMGRDGFTHNMLENIHAHWKRRRVCKIKCKGVCTVDMDNVRKQLEDKTGGQVIYSRGGLIYLFRGRNYNYRDRPRFPLMLWKPVSPVYPRLVQRVPDGLTLEEVTEMRRKGRDLVPICRLGKNNVYCDLVKNVKEAFEACELVRISCQGLNGSDYRKIGAKLKDLVPCVLVSFENEHILMWRGRDWKSSYPEPNNDVDRVKKVFTDRATFPRPAVVGQMELSKAFSSTITESMPLKKSTEEVDRKRNSSSSEDEELEGNIIHQTELVGNLMASVDSGSPLAECEIGGSQHPQSEVKELETDPATDARPTVEGQAEPLPASAATLSNSIAMETTIRDVDTDSDSSTVEIVEPGVVVELSASVDTLEDVDGSKEVSEFDGSNTNLNDTILFSPGSETSQLGKGFPLTVNKMEDVSEDKRLVSKIPRSIAARVAAEQVQLLLKMAVENGSAMILEDSSLDSDIVFEKAVALSKSTPLGPVFKYGLKKKVVEGSNEQPKDDLAEKEGDKASDLKLTVSNKRETVKKSSKKHSTKDIRADVLNIAPKGTLRVDELAKLLG